MHEAIQKADVIVIGPGSLYTSILPNLLVSGIAAAIREAQAAKVYVCNVATQKGETGGYAVADHVEALQAHTFPTIVDYVVANDRPQELGQRFWGRPVVSDGLPMGHGRLISRDLVDPNHPVRHDSGRLAQAIMDVYDGRRSGGVVAAETREG